MKGVIIAYPSQKQALQLKRALNAGGLEVLAVCPNGSAVLNMAEAVGEAVVVCPLILSDMPANHLAENLPGSFDVLALSSTDSTSFYSGLSILALPLDRTAFLGQVIGLCGAQSVYTTPRRKTYSAEDAALLTRAKKILQRTKGLSEEQAHRYLQRTAMAKGLKITALAKQITQQNS